MHIMSTGVYKNRNLMQNPPSYGGGGSDTPSYGGGGSGQQNWGQYGVASLQTAYGLYQMYQTQKALNALGAKKQYHETPAMRHARLMAEANAKWGFTPLQKQQFFANLANQNNLNYNKASEVAGGSLSSGINAANQYSKLNAMSQLANTDAQLQLQNQRMAADYARSLQELANRQTAVDQSERRLTEQALGQAGQAGAYNTFQGLNTAAAAYDGNSQSKQPLYDSQTGAYIGPKV